jgi:hypothetical protein
MTKMDRSFEDRPWLGWLAGAVASHPIVGLILEDHPRRLTHLHLMEAAGWVPYNDK